MILLVMSFIITPLLAGIFDDALLKDLVPGVGFRAAIYPDGGNSTTFSSGFMYVAYDYAWLNGTLPPFTTSTYALAQFLPAARPSVTRYGPPTLCYTKRSWSVTS